MTINDILDRTGDIKKSEMFSIKYKPVFFEISAIKNAVGNFVEKSQFGLEEFMQQVLEIWAPRWGYLMHMDALFTKKQKGVPAFTKC